MGGIVLLIYNSNSKLSFKTFTESLNKLNHRGTSNTEYVVNSNLSLDKKAKMYLSKKQISEYTPYTFIQGYHRHAINDQSINGSQPFEDPISHKILQYPDLKSRPLRTLMCDGEIYNYNELLANEKFTDKDIQSQSDVEIIMPLYIKYGLEKTLELLNGDFSFVITENTETYRLDTLNTFVARDTLGSRPLYMVKSLDKSLYLFVSELKAIPYELINNNQYIIQEVPPGSYWSFRNSIVENNQNEFVYYNNWNRLLENNYLYTQSDQKTLIDLYTVIKTQLTESVYSRYQLSELPVGILLSGGFDSCIILSLLIENLVSKNHDFIKNPIYAFTIGDIENEDVIGAQKCIDFLENKFKIDIHFHIIDVQNNKMIKEFVNDTIICLETYDTKTINTGIVFNILYKYIKENTPVRILLSGEGLTQIAGGHSSFDNKDEESFQKSTIKIINNLSKYELIRANKIACKYGLEVRHPFLDKNFIEIILKIHPSLKTPQIYELNKPKINKFIIRKAFDNGYLPYEILWKNHQPPTKSINNINSIINNYCENLYNDTFFYNYINNTNNNINNKQQLHYKIIFNKNYPKCNNLIPCYLESLYK